MTLEAMLGQYGLDFSLKINGLSVGRYAHEERVCEADDADHLRRG
jgi:hypothetical protein